MHPYVYCFLFDPHVHQTWWSLSRVAVSLFILHLGTWSIYFQMTIIIQSMQTPEYSSLLLPIDRISSSKFLLYLSNNIETQWLQ